MITIDPETSLGQLVAEQPGLARTFEELDFDYCCGGKASLAEAAAEHGLDPRTVALVLEAEGRALEAESGERDWREASLSELCDHIVSVHHSLLRRELPRIEGLLEKVVSRHGDTVPTLPLLEAEFKTLHADLIDHIDREEQGLFPLCRGLDGDRALDPAAMPQLGMHEAAHSDVGEALGRIRELAGGYDTSAALCTTHRVLLESLRGLELDLHQHVHEENNVLFTRLRGGLGERANGLSRA
jgi:regulator of cell morphogenesis and NO signaling